MSTLVTSAAVSAMLSLNNKWEVYDSGHTKKYNISPTIAAILALFNGGESVDNVFKILNNIVTTDYNGFLTAIDTLKDLKLLVSPDDPKHIFSRSVLNKWASYNWLEAANYYLTTFDYPFVDEKDASYASKDSKRMSLYYDEEPDLNRSKEYNDAYCDYTLPNMEESLSHFDMQFTLNRQEKKILSEQDIKSICTVALGRLRVRASNRADQADIIRKTSPSGGSRHPTEGYIVLLEQLGSLPKGIYHYSLNKNALELIHGDVPGDVQDICPGVFRASFAPKAIFLLTSLFERNMYRYREPRTFRTIFIDVGHIAETIKILSSSLGLQCFAHTYIDEEKVENILKLEKLKEGAIYSIAIA